MDLGGFNWTILDIVGPLLLLAVIAWAILRNRRARSSIDETERGTRRVYDQAEEVRTRHGEEHAGQDGRDRRGRHGLQGLTDVA